MTSESEHTSMLMSLHVILLVLHFLVLGLYTVIDVSLDHCTGPFQTHPLLVPKEVAWRR